MPKTIEQSKALIDALEEANFEVRSYSGRGLYGKECVSVRDASVWEVARAIPEDMNVPEHRSDSLGLGNVLYWPSYEWPKEGE